jgi:pimeloyl-ACP methyl ester carboxylesterase
MDFEQDELPPLPQLSSNTSPKRARRRLPSSSNSTIVSTTVVPTPGPDQVISTLIDSLTAISESARDQLRQEFAQTPSLDAFHTGRTEREYSDQPPSPGSFYAESTFESAFAPSIVANSDCDEDSDGDAAAPPVIRFSRASPSSHRKKPRKSSQTPTAMGTDRNLSIRNSLQSLRSYDAAQGGLLVNKRSSSVTSLAMSIRSARSRSPRKNSQAPASRDQSPHMQMRPTPDRGYSDSRVSYEHQRTDFDSPQQSGSSNNPLDEKRTGTTLSPLNRENLGEHLIPSRQSSIRKSDRKGHHRHSTGSRDLKNLKIDEELISSDDSTVRRIKELQEAREKRHNEWRKESRSPPENSPKRHSAPSPKPLRRSNTYHSSKLSVADVLVESEQETPLELSAQISAADLALMPALVASGNDNSPLTPVGAHSEPSAHSAPPATHIPSTVPKLSSPVPPKDRATSMQQKRSSTISAKFDSRAEDTRSVAEEVEAFLGASRLTQKLRHPRTGRTIAFSEVGDPDGFVVFCCVGMGLTRYVTTFYDELARTLKLRLITPDRPGVGESETVPERLNNPLTWVDDVAVICQTLEIARFSLLAHSAGTIYALATALKMPQFVRGRIHLLAPWIPPSQMPKSSTDGPDAQKVANLPFSHRVLSVLPAPILKVANSRFLSTSTVTGETKGSKSKRNKHLDYADLDLSQAYDAETSSILSGSEFEGPPSLRGTHALRLNGHTSSPSPEPRTSSNYASRPSSPRMTPEARAALYNTQLTHRIWTLATLNANPAVDLMTCLERKKPIGYRYADVTRSIVIRHGAKDTRVPLENVKWLESMMKRCELRVLENEGHSLMANASVMSGVLSEISKEWDEWEKIARHKRKKADSSAISVRSGM